MTVTRCCPPAAIAPAEEAVMPVGNLTFNGTPSGQWTPVPGTSLDLPSAGTYHLFADIRVSMVAQSTTTSGSAFIVTRIFDLTAGASVVDSERLIDQVITRSSSGQHDEEQFTASINKMVTVTGPATVQLQAARFLSGTTDADVTQQGIWSNANGRTTFSFIKVSG